MVNNDVSPDRRGQETISVTVRARCPDAGWSYPTVSRGGSHGEQGEVEQAGGQVKLLRPPGRTRHGQRHGMRQSSTAHCTRRGALRFQADKPSCHGSSTWKELRWHAPCHAWQSQVSRSSCFGGSPHGGQLAATCQRRCLMSDGSVRLAGRRLAGTKSLFTSY